MDRRDFLNGMALTIGACALTGTGLPALGNRLSSDLPGAAPKPNGYYPPELVGMRGAHDGSFEVVHSIAWGGKQYGRATLRVDDHYDLVVVGAGLSGLAAARYFQHENPDARILILDNHDDFGGHARRNEFTVDGHHLLGHGGSQSIDTPSQFSPEASALLKDIGIETKRFYDYYDRDFYASHGMAMGLFLSSDQFGKNHLQRAPVEMFGGFGVLFGAAGLGNDDELIESLPISPADKAKLRELIFEVTDYLPQMSDEEKEELLRSISYAEYLSSYAGASDVVIKLLDETLKQLFALNWRAVPAIQAIDLMMPGMQAFEFGGGSLVRRFAQARSWLPHSAWQVLADQILAQADIEPYIFHFPDGNASIARLLIRKLIPNVLKGNTMEDIVLASMEYDSLDVANNQVRCRLNSTVVDVRHQADQKGVDVSYVKDGKHVYVTATHAILACNNQVVPYICQELAQAQKDALDLAERAPLCYINVALRNWRAFEAAGVDRIYSPGTEFPHMLLDFPVSMGGVEFSADPDKPIVMHISYAPSYADKGDPRSDRELFRHAQRIIYAKSFEDFEASIKSQMNSMLGQFGFDADRDIAAITVNRWTHGYAYTPYGHMGEPSVDDPDSPHYAARQQNHRISIANSDSEYRAYVDGAFDSAWRAVTEQQNLAGGS